MNKAQDIKIFGWHAVEAAWCNKNREIKAVYVSEKNIKRFRNLDHKTPHLDRPKPQIIQRKDFDKKLGANTVHQGIYIITKPLEEIYVSDLVIRLKDKKDALVVMLDQVTDPHNVGAILRSAAVFGVDAIIMQYRHSPELGGVLAKSSSGALEHVSILIETNLGRTLDQLKEAGFQVLGLDERGVNMRESQKGKRVLVLGAEGKGLRASIKDRCDTLLQIPSVGEMSTLNVSNAAAVAFYALT